MFLKRAFYSMKYRKEQNIALTIAYTLIFALTLGILLVYLSASAQVDLLQKSLGCAVTLRTNVANITLPGGALKYCDIREADAQAFIDSPYVESYNKIGFMDDVALEGDLLPYVRDSNRGLYEEMTQGESVGYSGDCLMAPVTQSETFEAFTAFGFSLVEGRHFTETDTDAVIISTKLAERNGLKIGDQMSFASSYFSQRVFYKSEDDIQHITLTICGLMEVPDAKEYGYGVTVVASDPYNMVISSYEATKVLTNMYAPEAKLQTRSSRTRHGRRYAASVLRPRRSMRRATGRRTCISFRDLFAARSVVPPCSVGSTAPPKRVAATTPR